MCVTLKGNRPVRLVRRFKVSAGHKCLTLKARPCPLKNTARRFLNWEVQITLLLNDLFQRGHIFNALCGGKEFNTVSMARHSNISQVLVHISMPQDKSLIHCHAL